MFGHIRHHLLIQAALFVLLAPSPTVAQGRNGNLVTTKWVETNLGKPDVLILDASLVQQHAAKHIPGAVNVDMFVYGVGDLPVAETERLYQSWGVDPAKTIVLYDQGGSIMATRAFFSLHYAGFPTKNLVILDGGLARWEADGLPVTKDATPTPAKGSFRIRKRNDDVRVRLPEILTASGDPENNALVEGLDANWHFGQVVAFGREGHIPNGILMPAADFYNADKTFKSPGEIRRMLRYLNIRPEQQIHVYCGGGVAASVPFFALKFLADYPKVKLFIESEMGWLSDERELPYWTYDAPFLMRKAGWLQTWSGRMLRTYVDSKLSILDVRSPEAYSHGHVPFAVNVPAGAFKRGLTDPGTLAQALGAAGVDVSHEAVVISGAGLTKEAALAFAMLEKLGQRRVSLLIDSLDRWTKLGFPLSKEPTVVGSKKGRGDLSIPPAVYPSAFRQDVIVSDPKITHGVYPKVFIAAGSSLPMRVPEGKIIHVPWTELVKDDGTPKAAKDIWNILTKAGVPRYAEIICISDDPGEAAVSYFILRLMGYPDIKILM